MEGQESKEIESEFSQTGKDIIGYQFTKPFPPLDTTANLYMYMSATCSGTKVRTIVTLVLAERGRSRLECLRHLNFDHYPSSIHAGPWVTLVATHATIGMS